MVHRALNALGCSTAWKFVQLRSKILRSTLNRHYEFLPGTNAICGENGAGKTSILEAIAWVLIRPQRLYAG